MNSNKRKSVLQERRAAEDIGGKVQPGSGAPQHYKSDVRKVGDSRLECKTTSSKSFSLKLSDLEKIKAEAIMGQCEGWAFQVEFQGSTSHKRFAIIDWQEYLDLKAKPQESPCPTCGASPRKMSCPIKCDEV